MKTTIYCALPKGRYNTISADQELFWSTEGHPVKLAFHRTIHCPSLWTVTEVDTGRALFLDAKTKKGAKERLSPQMIDLAFQARESKTGKSEVERLTAWKEKFVYGA